MRNCNPERIPDDARTYQILYGGRGFITLKIDYADGGWTESGACNDITFHHDGRISYIVQLYPE